MSPDSKAVACYFGDLSKLDQTESAWDFVRIAKKWQAQWQEKKSFEPIASKDSRKFFFTVPYPYVSGLLHAGHGRTYTNGDVIARFHRMMGENVLWPMAFHITGTPVLAISAKIKAGDEATIKMFEEYVLVYEQDKAKVNSIVQSFCEPWNVVNYFSDKLIGDFTSMGYSLDMSRKFTSGDPEYNKFIQWQFLKYEQKGYLKQASYPILYCTNDKNAVGEDDIKDGDSDSVEVQRFVAEKFQLEGDLAFIVSATLRPETVFGITNEFVNPSATYVRAKVTSAEGDWSEVWFVSKQASDKLSNQNLKVEVLQEIPGDFFVGKYCTSPLGVRVPVLPADFVDPTEATGFVHSVPAHAPHDYAAIEELKKNVKLLEKYSGARLKEAAESIKPISVVSVEGYGEFPAIELCQRMGIVNAKDKTKLEKATKELYKAEFYGGKLKENCMQFAGMGSEEAKTKVADWLKAQGKAADFFETSRPALCRCGGTVIAAVLNDQWFIDFNSPGWKELSRKALDKMTIYPPVYRKQFEDVFSWLDKRPCARRRGLGTQLPFNNEWIIESLSDSTIYMALYTIIKGIRTSGLKPHQLTPKFFDFVFLGKGEAGEVAKSIDASHQILQSIRAEFLCWYPNDLRHTGIAHITNHLSFFIFAHTAIFPEEHWPKGITLNELVISEGAKMSKSKGNVVLLNKVASEVGPDVFRLYAVGSADLGSVLDYRWKEVESTKRTLTRFANHITLLQELSNKPGSNVMAVTHTYDWFTSKFEKAVKEATLALTEFRLRDYVQIAMYEMLNNFEYFMRRSNDVEKKMVADSDISGRWVQLLAPVIPHICEELWANGAGNGLVSVSSWPVAQEKLIDSQLDVQEGLLMQVAADGRKIRDMLKGKKLSRVLFITSSPEKKRELLKCLNEPTAEKAVEATADEVLKAHLLRNYYPLKASQASLELLDDFAVLNYAKDFLSSELGLAVTVEAAQDSSNPKAARAIAGKPAIVLE